MSANTFADWAMEAGDIVTVSRGGTSYQSPVGTSTLKWSGKQQIQIATEGSRERDAISRISARKYAKGGGGGSGIRSAQELYWEMFSEDGQLHAVISATAESLTADYTKKIGDVDDALEGKITVTAELLRTEYTDRINNTQTQINQNASTLSMAVGRVKYTNTVHYANKSSFPATGTAGVLYYADNTGYAYLYMPGTHSYERATADEFGNANFLKAGEIAISINESGQTAAKLDADVIYAGRGSTTIADLELPDWMDTTEGLIATKATIVDLNALKARVGTLEADSITTKNMESVNAMFNSVGAKNIAASGTLSIKDGNTYYGVQRSISDLQIVRSGNVYTLQYKKWADSNWTSVSQSFSRATSLSGAWSGGIYTVTASPQGARVATTITTISGPRNITANGTYTYKVMYEGPSGTDVDTGYPGATVTVNVPNEDPYSNSMSIVNCVAHVTSSGSTEYLGQLYYKDDQAGTYEKVTTNNRYWYYSTTRKAGTTTVHY